MKNIFLLIKVAKENFEFPLSIKMRGNVFWEINDIDDIADTRHRKIYSPTFRKGLLIPFL